MEVHKMNLKLKSKIIEMFRTQADFAAVVKVHESDVSRTVRGRRKLPATEQKRWAAALGTEPERLFGE